MELNRRKFVLGAGAFGVAAALPNVALAGGDSQLAPWARGRGLRLHHGKEYQEGDLCLVYFGTPYDITDGVNCGDDLKFLTYQTIPNMRDQYGVDVHPVFIFPNIKEQEWSNVSKYVEGNDSVFTAYTGDLKDVNALFRHLRVGYYEIKNGKILGHHPNAGLIDDGGNRLSLGVASMAWEEVHAQAAKKYCAKNPSLGYCR